MLSVNRLWLVDRLRGENQKDNSKKQNRIYACKCKI